MAQGSSVMLIRHDGTNRGGAETRRRRPDPRKDCTVFESFDATLLARIQFAFTVSFHIIFPAFSIGLASYLAVLEALWL